MTIELNDSAIYDEIFALTALRASCRRDRNEENMLLTRDNLPGLRNMARMMFADTVVRLGSLVKSCDMGDSDPAPALPYSNDSTQPLSLELEGVTSTGSLAIKRTLEHIVAAKVLEAVAAGGDHEFADTLRCQHMAATDALRETLGNEDNCATIAIFPHRW